MYVCSPLSHPPGLELIKGVIFDCDGVMVSSLDANRMYYNIIRQRLGLLSLTPDEEAFVHMHSVGECLDRIIPAERREEAERMRRDIDYREILPYVFLEPGLTELLDMLRSRGVAMAVNTNRTDTMELLLESFDLERYFNPVVTAAKVSRPKPNPEGVHKILAAWGVAREEVAYLGDSVLDERTARAAGTPFWAYKNPALLAYMHVPDFDSLRLCLGRALSERLS